MHDALGGGWMFGWGRACSTCVVYLNVIILPQHTHTKYKITTMGPVCVYRELNAIKLVLFYFIYLS